MNWRKWKFKFADLFRLPNDNSTFLVILMDKTLQISRTLNLLVLIYMAFVTITALLGKIVFGHGLGDIFYIGICITLVVVHTIATRLISKYYKEPMAFLTCGIIALVFACLITYKFTFGRGLENSWDGNVFH